MGFEYKVAKEVLSKYNFNYHKALDVLTGEEEFKSGSQSVHSHFSS